ncbi:MAG TPA: efflux RND transporter periplasmic adaptor subunit [Opitutaceae bacterium]|nr:efflux RND transporter periplasmic adaptor subunit [Opitutaceae bacterium]
MKSSLRFFTLLLVTFALVVRAYAADQLYTCGMHPQIIKHEPGNCPICGMKLTPIKSSAASPGSASGERKVKYYKSTMMPGEVKSGPGKDSMGMDMVPVYEGDDSTASNIQIDAATIQRMNLRTALVEHGPVRREFRTVGTVTYNEQGLRDITTKYEGWLEKLFVNTTWTVVKAGEPLFEIYSPDLYNAELNYVVALKGEGDAGGPLTRAALARLQLFDIPKDVIAELNESKEPRRTFVFRAPADGVVIEKMAVAGQMMKPGEQIYRLADLSSVWVQAEIYEKDLPYVHPGDAAAVQTSYGPTRSFDGKVGLVVPQVQEQTRTATARIVLSNPDLFLRPGMYVTVRFAATLSDDAVLVPDMAVLRSGERNTVFVALEGGFFEPRDVKIGARSEGDTYEVLSGLKAGERVVTSGQFMLDSESQLREAIQKMLKPAGTVPAPAPAATPPTTPAASAHEHVMVSPAAFQPLALAMADGADALAKDDLTGYNTKLPVLRAALVGYFSADEHAAHGPLDAFQSGLEDASDLKTARAAFGPLSTAVSNLVLTGSATGLHVFECSMVKARWVQRDAGTKNPFYGEKMLTCGEELEVKPTASLRRAPPLDPAALAGKLPAGHPPIAAMQKMTLKQFADSQRGIGPSLASAESNGDGCGSCGMTAAQMAAGEPCEHDAKTKE